MKIQKMSLATAQGKLSRKEMKTIMAGSDIGTGGVCVSTRACDSGCAVTNNGETGVCSYCCYA
ncbi:hypothetical protein J0383_09580 [Flavobacterium endoglycinae]|uniref:Bacteriocin n=1 Tax=Flavobacterium endoglycinae TaxID=2816357 RepID=A0ABX7QKH1_9FLAO|nr:hypothetical protein [Flavobacterium endoglycinae]QSW91038.1 hypothetical protein J0383_09580 [Flavobacterium endoglycinae]